MKYQTRMLTADTDISLGPNYHAKGERFSASEADAEYLVQKKKASYAEENQSQAAPQMIALPVVDPPAVNEAQADEPGDPDAPDDGAETERFVTSTVSLNPNPVRRSYVRRTPGK